MLEFPFHKFLAACRNRAATQEFDPEGSFLLGNPVSPREPLLHDNLVAMRMQLYLNLALGAFYYDGEVGQGPTRRYACRAQCSEGSPAEPATTVRPDERMSMAPPGWTAGSVAPGPWPGWFTKEQQVLWKCVDSWSDSPRRAQE